MSTYRLDKLFAPHSIAIVGASPRERSLGRAILRNLIGGGFAGRIHLVNPDHPEIDGVKALASTAAVIITAGLGHGPGSLAEATLSAARPHGLRLVGPNCLGVMVPGAKLNASFAARMPASGDLALISQSGAIVAGMTEWATQRAIGFLVRSDLKGHGLGWSLMQIMIEYARWLGLNTVEGQVLRENTTMLAMCRDLGFFIKEDPDDRDVCLVTLPVANSLSPLAG
jgi:CoA binding protein/acetyltransferase (GNAT) family protein